MSIDSRLNKLAAILRKAVNYGVDDYNPDDEEVIAPVEVVDEDISDMEELDDPKAERLELIKERHRELNRSPMMNDRARSRAEEAARLDALEEHRNTQEVDMTIPRGPGIQDVIDKRQNELEEAISSGDAQAIDTAQKNLDSAEAMRKSLEDGTWVNPNPRQKPEESTETPYDRATDTEKNREAIDEIQETLDMVDNKKKGRDRERALDIDVDDVLVLAETMYSKEEAKEALGDIDLVDLQKRVMDKYNELNTEKATAAQAIEMLYRQAGIVSAAEEKEDDPYSKFKNMTLLEKIESADYVQLYALDKLFTKQLKEKAAEAKGDEDETINPDDLQESVNSLLGKKPNDYAPGPVKKFSPEEIEAYERKMNQAANAKAKTVKARGLFEDKVCSVCGEASDCQCPGGPKIASVTNKYRTVKAQSRLEDPDPPRIHDLPVPPEHQFALNKFYNYMLKAMQEPKDKKMWNEAANEALEDLKQRMRYQVSEWVGEMMREEFENYDDDDDETTASVRNKYRKAERKTCEQCYGPFEAKPGETMCDRCFEDVEGEKRASVTNKPFSVREAMMSPDEHGFFADEDEEPEVRDFFEGDEVGYTDEYGQEWNAIIVDVPDIWGNGKIGINYYGTGETAGKGNEYIYVSPSQLS